MSEQINSGQVEETEISTSGLLLSVEPLQQAGATAARLDASDGNADTGGSGEKDTSDDAGTADTDGSDKSGTTDTDLTDSLGADTDGSDDSDAEIKIDGKDA